MGSPHSFRRRGTLFIASTYFNMFPTAASFFGTRKNDETPYSFTRKNGNLHLLVRFGHRTKAANFFICTHLSRVKRKAIVKNIFHCTLGDPPYRGTPWRTYSQYSVIIYSILRGTDSKVVEMFVLFITRKYPFISRSSWTNSVRYN